MKSNTSDTHRAPQSIGADSNPYRREFSLRRLDVLFLAFSFLIAGCSDDPTTPGGPHSPPDTLGIKVLMIGNSLTATYDAPGIIQELADSSGVDMYVEKALFPGRDLARIIYETNTLERIGYQKWDYVVLQDGHYEIAFPEDHHYILPPFQELKDAILANHSETKIILFLDWSMPDGVYYGDDYYTFEEFQWHIRNGALIFADQMGFLVAPIGVAVSTVVAERPDIDLFHYDDVHPSREGAYLQACVYYSVIFQMSSEGIDVRRTLTEEAASYLQRTASSTVLDSLDLWNISPLEGPAGNSSAWFEDKRGSRP